LAARQNVGSSNPSGRVTYFAPTNAKTCRRCGKPVVVNAQPFDTFEGTYWLCFHLESEHGDRDPDEMCDDPSCFWKRRDHVSQPQTEAVG
jgi:hypothetical protein